MHDLDLDPMIKILIFDLDIVIMYHHTKNEVTAQTDRQTHKHRHDENITYPHTRDVINQLL